MNKSILLASAISLAVLASCAKDYPATEISEREEMTVLAINESAKTVTKGYVEGSEGLLETAFDKLHTSSEKLTRTLQVSSYLYPQNGKEGNYFVDVTYTKEDDLWHAAPKVYWPVGGALDFLAYSLSTEAGGPGSGKNVSVAWDKDNAASALTLTVPAENTQNDILYSSAYGIKPKMSGSEVNLHFKHSQAWLEFALTSPGDVKLKDIELEDIYNSGTLHIINNAGDALGEWDFSGQNARAVNVDNYANVSALTTTPSYLDMLIPQQPKTAFSINYTIGTDSMVYTYRFETDRKTWLAGEKYVYNINISAKEVTVTSTVAPWVTQEISVNASFGGIIKTAPVTGQEALCAATESKEINPGETVTVSVTPAAGYKVAKWYKDATGVQELTNNENITISGNSVTVKNVTALSTVTFYASFEEIIPTP